MTCDLFRQEAQLLFRETLMSAGGATDCTWSLIPQTADGHQQTQTSTLIIQQQSEHMTNTHKHTYLNQIYSVACLQI